MTGMHASNRRFCLLIPFTIIVALGGCADSNAPENASTAATPVPAAQPSMVAPHQTTSAVAPTESPIATLMRMLDRNGDGQIARQEHADSASRMFESMDADHDGEVTAAEMDATRRGLYGADRTAAAAEIAQADGNHDGMLTAEEHATATRVMFDRFDADHDNSLTLAELEAAEASENQTEPAGGNSCTRALTWPCGARARTRPARPARSPGSASW